jgi:hypothetical protein
MVSPPIVAIVRSLWMCYSSLYDFTHVVRDLLRTCKYNGKARNLCRVLLIVLK